MAKRRKKLRMIKSQVTTHVTRRGEPIAHERFGHAPPQPIRHYAKLSLTDKHPSITLSADQLSYGGGTTASYTSCRADIGKECVGRWYFEVECLVPRLNYYEMIIGLTNLDRSLNVSSYPGDSSDGIGYQINYPTGGKFSHYYNAVNSEISGPDSVDLVPGDIMCFHVNFDDDQLFIRKNGAAWQRYAGSVLLSTVANNHSGLPKEIYPTFCIQNLKAGDRYRVNFGESPFAFPVPDGTSPGWYREEYPT